MSNSDSYESPMKFLLTKLKLHLIDATTVLPGWLFRTVSALETSDIPTLATSVRELIDVAPCAFHRPDNTSVPPPPTVPPNETLTNEQRKQLNELIEKIEKQIAKSTPP